MTLQLYMRCQARCFAFGLGFVVQEFARDLHHPISQERLESFRPAGGSDLDMLVTYFWNLALGEALHHSVQSVEVALRNATHSAATNAFGTAYWFDQPGLLLPRERDLVAQARAELVRNGKQQNDGRIVAVLTFGFWTGLLNRPYESRLWHTNNLTILKTAFPHASRRYQNRGQMWHRFDSIRRLRNRIMHAEPIWQRPNLARDHQDILEAIGWISCALRDQLGLLDRFPDIYRDGQTEIEQAIRLRLNLL